MGKIPPIELESECYHCIISRIAQLAVSSGADEPQKIVADLMQTAAEIIESQDAAERADYKAFALLHFEDCCKDAREAFDSSGGIGQPAGHA